MSFLIQTFNTILYQPLFNALVLLYQYVPGRDFGLAIIVLTLIIRFLLSPLMANSIKSQKAISQLQPKINEIQRAFKDNKEKQTKEMMALYQKEKINPFGGCLPLLVQLPILIALYQVFWQGFKPETMAYIYSFVPNPGAIDPNFLGLVNLAGPSLLFALLAGATQFFQTKMLAPATKKSKQEEGAKPQFSNILQKQMTYLFPVFTVLILLRLPSALGLYWTVNSLFSIVQQYLILKPRPKTSPDVNK